MMTEAVRRQLLFFTLIGLMISAIIVWDNFRPGDLAVDTTGQQYGRDFINVWAAPQIAALKGIAAVFDIHAYNDLLGPLYGARIPTHYWSYPPTFLLFAYPFGELPYWPALLLWSVLGFTIYATVVLARIGRPARLFVLAILLLTPASLINLFTGQNGFFTAALFLGGVAMLDRRPWFAGVLLGLLTVKPQLGLLLPIALITVGAWRSIASASLVALGLVIATLALWGTAPWIDWYTKTGTYLSMSMDQFEGFYTYMMPSVYAAARIDGLPMGAANALQAIVAVAVIAAVAVLFRRTTDVTLRALLLASGALLVSPYSFNYDLPILTGAIVWRIAASAELGDTERRVYGAAWLMPMMIIPLHIVHVGIAPLVTGAVFVTTALMIYRGKRQASQQPAAILTPA
jgi:hypothetical protein